MKLSMPTAIFSGMAVIAAAIYFGPGSKEVGADVSGKDEASMAKDGDFEKEVLTLVENHCVVISAGMGTLGSNFDRPIDCEPTLN